MCNKCSTDIWVRTCGPFVQFNIYLLSISSMAGLVLDVRNIKMLLLFRSLKLIQRDWNKPTCSLVWFRELQAASWRKDPHQAWIMIAPCIYVDSSQSTAHISYHLLSRETYEVGTIIHILLMRKLGLRELKPQSHNQLAGQQQEIMERPLAWKSVGLYLHHLWWYDLG